MFCDLYAITLTTYLCRIQINISSLPLSKKIIFIILNARYGSVSVCRHADVNVQRPEVSYPFGSCELSNVRELSPL